MGLHERLRAQKGRSSPLALISVVRKERSMCSGCLENVALIIASVISTGGFTALVMNKFRLKKKDERNSDETCRLPLDGD